MEVENLYTITKNGIQITGEITGKEDSDTLLVFSHGFGARSDSNEMFYAIRDRNKYRYLTALFNYISLDLFSNITYVPPFSVQIEKLETVIVKILEKYENIKKVIIIGHSQGCFIPSMLLKKRKLPISKLILISPPPTTNLMMKMIEYFKAKKESIININGDSILQRSNGDKTIVPKEFWIEAKKQNPIKLYKYLNENYDTTFIFAQNDNVIPQEEYSNFNKIGKYNGITLPGDHDFKDSYREKLLKTIDEII